MVRNCETDPAIDVSFKRFVGKRQIMLRAKNHVVVGHLLIDFS